MGRVREDWRDERIDDLMDEMAVIRDCLAVTTRSADVDRLCHEYNIKRNECQSLEAQQNRRTA